MSPMPRNDAAAKRNEDRLLELQIGREREETRRVVRGEEFDVVFGEISARLESLEIWVRETKAVIEALQRDFAARCPQ